MQQTFRIRIPEMDCPVEVGEIRSALEKDAAVSGLQFSTASRSLALRTGPEHIDAVLAAIRKVGYTPKLEAPEAAPDGESLILHIKEMDCPVEVGEIRGRLERESCVRAMEFSTASRTATFSIEPGQRQTVIDAIRALGYTPRLATEEVDERTEEKAPWARLGCGIALAAAAEAAELLGQDWWLTLALSLAAIACVGCGTILGGAKSLARLNFNIKALMAVAILGAVAIGSWCEAAMVIALYELGEAIEGLSMQRARNAVRELMTLAPDTAIVVCPDGTTTRTPSKDVAVGTLVRIASGDRVPLDGLVVSGTPSLDQSAVTGESMPVAKAPGDEVWAGTVNKGSPFTIRTTAMASASFTARILRAIEQAQGARAPIERTIDKFAKVYTPSVFVVALATAILPPLAVGADWLTWIYRGLTLLVIACPCALVISTPVTIVCAMARATRSGLIIKGGAHLEAGRQIKTVAFDKTGTLTLGRPQATAFERIGFCQESRAVAVAAALAESSRHPVSQAVAHFARQRGIDPARAQEIDEIPGHGMQGVFDGSRFTLTDHGYLAKLPAKARARIEALQERGLTTVVLADSFGPCAVWGVEDTIKEGAKEAVSELARRGVRSVMLSGDNQKSAEAVGQAVGIQDIRARLTPQDKLAALDALSAEGGVAMVGDGINDAPALARADVGFAMGTAGSGTAIETAAVAIMDDDPRRIARFVDLSRATFAILVQNIAFTLCVKLAFALLDWAGMASMWMAVFADTGTMLIVVANGLRMLRK